MCVQGTGPRKPERTGPGDTLLAALSSSHSPERELPGRLSGRAHRRQWSVEADGGPSVV